MRKIRYRLFLIAGLVLLLTACQSGGQVMDGDGMVRSFTQISQDEAREMMSKEDGHVIVDVRRQDEYEAGHIPGAICIPNESIGTEQPAELPDLDQILLIYCRSGRRSKQAAQKLLEIGYTNVYEFGGIKDWTGEVVTGSPEAEIQAQSTDDAEQSANGETQATNDAAQTTNEEAQRMTLRIGETEVPVTWEENASVEALAGLLDDGPLTIQMAMYGGFEQVGPIGQSIASEDEQTTTEAGDIVLYSSDQIVIFYGSNSWAYTRLGHADLSQEELEELLGNGDVVLTLQR